MASEILIGIMLNLLIVLGSIENYLYKVFQFMNISYIFTYFSLFF